MRTDVIFEGAGRRWIVLGRDPDRPDRIIDSNQFAVQTQKGTMLLDPGGAAIFPAVLAALATEVPISSVYGIFASHQDPDIVSSLPMWADLCPKAKLYCAKIWKGFICHFAAAELNIVDIPDAGCVLEDDLVAVPAHYCHSSAQFSVWDPIAKVLFSADVGAALVSLDYPLVVEDFDHHVQFMEGFHLRWMPANTPLRNWVQRVRRLEPEVLCPQHGAIFRGDDVGRLLDWLEQLDVEVCDPSSL